MAIIRKYNLKDLEINKKEINQKFFKNNKNSKILDTFNEIKSYLSNTAYSIEEDEVDIIFTDSKNIYDDGIAINGSLLNNIISVKNRNLFSFDIIPNPTIILSTENRKFTFDKKSIIFSEISKNILNLDFKNLKIINAINELGKTKNKNLETYNLGAVLFHEIGHYVQSAWQSKNQLPTDSTDIQGIVINSLINPSYTKNNNNVDIFIYGLDFLGTPRNQRSFLSTTFSESFADVFSLMMSDQFYSPEISKIIQGRIIKNREIEHDSVKFSNYYSVDAMKEYINIKDQVKDLNIDEKVSLAVKISTKQAFNTFVNVFNNRIKELTNFMLNDEKFIENEHNKKIIYEKIRTISYLGGVIFPDGDLNNRNLTTIANKLENSIGLKGIKEFIEQKQVQACFDKRASKFNILYGESKRYFIDRMTNNSITIKSTVEDNYKYIENKILDLKSLNLLNPQSSSESIILRENSKRINLIIDNMVNNKMLNHKEAEVWLLEESKNYSDLICANVRANEFMSDFINSGSQSTTEKPLKKTLKEKIKETLDIYIPERKEIPVHNNLKKKI